MIARLQYLGRFALSQTGTNRHAVTQTFGGGYDIRAEAKVLVAEIGAGPAVTGLYFVEHHQQLVVITQGTYAGQIVGAGSRQTAFALYRFQHYRNDIRVGFDDGFYGIQILIRHTDKTIEQRAKAFLHLGVTGSGQGGHGTAVEGLGHNNDDRLMDAAVVTVFTRNFNRRFVGFGTGVGEKHVFHTGDTYQCFSQRLLLADAIQV